MSNWKVFAEDAGTGLQDQSDHDFGDGANFGAHVHSPNDTDYAPVAPTLSADYSVPEVTLGEAQYKIKATNVSGRERDGVQTTWPEVTFVVKAPQTTVSLTDGAVNHIYVDVDLTTTGDDATYVVNTTGTAPSDSSLKVAEVDTTANTTDVFSANPSVVGQTVASQYVINEDVTIPDGHGAVAVGPLEGDGSITGNGRLGVIQEGTQFTDNVDAQGNDINNAGSVDSESLSTERQSIKDTSTSGQEEIIVSYPSENHLDTKDRKRSGIQVSTTKKQIQTTSPGSGTPADDTMALVMVSGSQNSGSPPPTFNDLVITTQYGAFVVFSDGLNGPANRDYTTDGSGNLQLSVDSDTYTVGTRSFENAKK